MQPAESRSQTESTKTRVLVIDDDSSMLQLVRSVLEADGYECRTASSGEDALNILKSVPGILVAISDINMAGMDGIMFLKSVSSGAAFASVPRVVFLTAHPQVDYAVAALRLGAIDFLSKPVPARELLNAVRNAVDRVRSERGVLQLPEQAAALARQAEALAEALKSWRSPQSESEAVLADSAGGDSRSVKLNEPASVNLALLGLDRLRRPGASFALLGELDDVAWELLLQLLRAANTGERLSVSALSISVEHVSSTTALRRIQELVKAGHIERQPDPMDARRDFVMLSTESRAALEKYLQQVAKELAAAASVSR